MGEQKKGFMYRMIMGKERDDSYARSTLPTSRWGLFWDILKGRLGKLCIINLLMLLFLLPLAVIVFFRVTMTSAAGMALPFLGNIGIGFPGNLDSQLQYLSIVNSNDLLFMLMLVPASLVAAIGLSGGFYIMRNIVWTEGTFVANDFWRGIKLNILQYLFIAAVISVVVSMSVLNFDMMNYWEYINGITFWTVASRISTWIMLAIISMMCFWMCSLSVTYKLKIRHLIKNSFILTVGMLIQNIVFIVLGAVPFIVGMLLSLVIPGTFMTALLIMVYLLIGISIFVLVWMNFSQWAFDKFINDRIDGAVKNRGIYPKIKDGEEMEKRKKAQAAKYFNPKKKRAVKPVTDKDVTLTDISGSGFTRANIAKLEEEKAALKIEAEKYAEEHKFDDEAIDEDIIEGEDSSFDGYEEAMLLEGYDPAVDGEYAEADGDRENPDKE